MKMKIFLSSLLLAMAGAAQAQGDILVTRYDSGAFTEFVLELVNDANLTGAKLSMNFEGVDVSSVDLSACTSSLDSSVVSVCEFAGDSLKIGMIHVDKLPTGEIGRIRVPNSSNLQVELVDGEFVDSAARASAMQPLLAEEANLGRGVKRR